MPESDEERLIEAVLEARARLGAGAAGAGRVEDVNAQVAQEEH